MGASRASKNLIYKAMRGGRKVGSHVKLVGRFVGQIAKNMISNDHIRKTFKK